MFLIRWFLFRFRRVKHESPPIIIEFLRNHGEIKKFISIVSMAEFIKVLLYDKDFINYKLTTSYANKLIQELQDVIELKVIHGEKISDDIVLYIERHPELIDCIHLDIAKSNELCFITDEKKIGKLKAVYGNIMTENKLMKQFD
ncbi:hypothetical protein A3K63_02775 [Candidatus Micrarchaeota archaeon RBG_16_49_10]|nr:MAG: hypothetical protein A3K63_02775 [Candidatus Micrarchaeota archaeon RBG_16_49_10]